MASSSRSAKDKYRSDRGFDDGVSVLGGMPPASRNHRVPTACDTSCANRRSSLDRPAAIDPQNRRWSSRPAAPGRPGDLNPFVYTIRAPNLIRHCNSYHKVLRRPVKSALFTAFTGIISAILDAPLRRRLTVSKPATDYEPHETKYHEEDESKENSIPSRIFILMALA